MTTWKAPSEEQNWSYLGYLASNVRALLIPLAETGTIDLASHDEQYLLQGKRFFESAVEGCASYAEPDRLFSVKEQNVPRAATAFRIAVDIYNDIHATPPASLTEFGEKLRSYVATLDAIREKRAVPQEFKTVANELERFLRAVVQKATEERYRIVKHDHA